MGFSTVDLALPGPALDVVLSRTYRSDTLGSGPFGPGWSFGYDIRLRPLPTGDVELFRDGRRETFTGRAGLLEPPAGVFASLTRSGSGFFLVEADGTRLRFDGAGRLVEIADRLRTSPHRGSAHRFVYDARGRLVQLVDSLERTWLFRSDSFGRFVEIEDPTGRRLEYAYDAHGRLESVTWPDPGPGADLDTADPRPTVRYGYLEPSASSETVARVERTNLRSIRVVPFGASSESVAPWLETTWGDVDGDGRREEVVAQRIGESTTTIAYDLATRTATTTDARGAERTYLYSVNEQLVRFVDPIGATWTAQYDGLERLTRTTGPTGRVTTYVYDESSTVRARGDIVEIRQIADSRGANGSADELVTRITYGRDSRVPVHVSGPGGLDVQVTLDVNGLPTSSSRAIDDERRAVTRYQWDARGRLVEHVDPDGVVTRRSYAADGPGRGFLERVVVDPDSLDLRWTFEHSERGEVVRWIDPTGVEHRRRYDALGQPIEETLAAVVPAAVGEAIRERRRWRYDVRGDVVRAERSDGPVGTDTMAATLFERGTLGRLEAIAQEIVPGGATVRSVFRYDAAGDLAETVDPTGASTRYLRDARGLVERVERGAVASATSSSTRKSSSEPLSIEDLAYDAEGALVAWTDGLGSTWTAGFDGHGRLDRTTAPTGVTVDRAYFTDESSPRREIRALATDGTLLSRSESIADRHGRPLETRRWWVEDGAAIRPVTTTTSWTPGGRAITAADPVGRVVGFEHDSAGRHVATALPGGDRLELELDALGRTIRRRAVLLDPDGITVERATETVRDALGRIVARIDGEGGEWRLERDVRGRVVHALEPGESIGTRYQHDALGRLTRWTAPNDVEMSFGYDAAGRPTSQVDALGATTTWTYDGLGRTVAQTGPGGETWLTAYDAAHRPIHSSDPNGTAIARTFDPLGRVLSEVAQPDPDAAFPIGGSTTRTFGYDPLGRLERATHGSIAVRFEHDGLGRVVAETVAGLGGVSDTRLEQSWSDADDLERLRYPSGLDLAFWHDGAGRVVAQSPPPAEPPDDPNALPDDPWASWSWLGSQLSDRSRGTLAEGWRYDDAARPTSRQASTSTLKVFAEESSYEPRGLLDEVTRLDTSTRRSFQHDSFGRLLGATRDGAPLTSEPPELSSIDGYAFTYDAAQNFERRESFVDGISSFSTEMPRAEPHERPASVDGTPLVYDVAGNLVEAGGRRYVYDAWNRLVRVEEGGLELARYVADGLGRRVRRESPGEPTEDTVWHGWRELERRKGGVLHARHVFGRGHDEIVRADLDVDGNGTFDATWSPLYDASGNVTALVDAAGQVVARYTTSPYGYDRSVTVDATAPRLEQIRVDDGVLVLEADEALSIDAIRRALLEGRLRLFEPSSSPLPSRAGPSLKSASIALEAEIAPLPAGYAGRSVHLRPAISPAPGTALRLEIEADAVVDTFGSPLDAPASHDLIWPAPSDVAVVVDTEPPSVEHVVLRDDRITVRLTEPPDPAAVTSAFTIDEEPVAWTVAPHALDLVSPPLEPGLYVLRASSTEPLDLSGRPLVEPLELVFTVDGVDRRLYEAPEKSAAPTKSEIDLAWPYHFHGRPHDPTTGLVHFRHRDYDPRLGRFLQPDPLGYVDGPNLYQFALNNPVDLADPLGLYAGYGQLTEEEIAVSADANSQFHREVWPRRLARERQQFTEYLIAQGFDSSSHQGPLTQQAFDYYRAQERSVVDAARWAGIVAGPEKCDLTTVLCNVDWNTLSTGTAAMEVVVSTSLTLFGPGTTAGGLFKRPLDIARHRRGNWVLGNIARDRMGREAGNFGGGATYIYRGLHANHPALGAARQGRVIPGDVAGNLSSRIHNYGDVAGSPFTSWTHRLDIARYHAMKEGDGGLILRVRSGPPPPNATWSWELSEDVFRESEVLLRGVREGVEVYRP